MGSLTVKREKAQSCTALLGKASLDSKPFSSPPKASLCLIIYTVIYSYIIACEGTTTDCLRQLKEETVKINSLPYPTSEYLLQAGALRSNIPLE